MLWLMAAIALTDVITPDFNVLAVEARLGMEFKETATTSLRMDIYLPKDAPAPCPAVVFVHGGAWFLGSKSDYVDFALALASRGIAGVLFDFRLTPCGGIRDQVMDIKDAVRWLRAHAAAYNIDPDRIGLCGSSSGGHLAALAAMAGDGEGYGDDPPGQSSAVQAACYVYGVYDMIARASDAPWAWRLLLSLLTGGHEGDPDEVARFYSPLYLVDGSEPPTLLIHGAVDTWVPIADAEQLADTLHTYAVPAEVIGMENLGHGFIKLQPWTRPLVFDMLWEFFAETLASDR